MTEEDEFFAWLDGELAGEQAERVAARVAASPELTASADRHRRLKAELRGAFDPVLRGSVPPTFEAAKVIEFAARSSGRQRRGFGLPHWAAMAASLALGLAIGTQFVGRSQSPVSVEGGQLVASASLDEALERRLAGSPATDGTRIGLSFRDSTGTVCRTFADSTASGLACRDRNQWEVRGLFPAPEGQAGDYRMAAGEDPRLAALVDQTIQGEPFTAAQERAALQRGWR